MPDITNNKFDVDSLLNEVNLVIQKGMNHLLKDFIQKYKIYEETHKGVLNLPSVKYLIDCRQNDKLDSEVNVENNEDLKTILVNIAKDLVKEEVKTVENSLLSNFETNQLYSGRS